jgi:hypothetical protein
MFGGDMGVKWVKDGFGHLILVQKYLHVSKTLKLSIKIFFT